MQDDVSHAGFLVTSTYINYISASWHNRCRLFAMEELSRGYAISNPMQDVVSHAGFLVTFTYISAILHNRCRLFVMEELWRDFRIMLNPPRCRMKYHMQAFS